MFLSFRSWVNWKFYGTGKTFLDSGWPAVLWLAGHGSPVTARRFFSPRLTPEPVFQNLQADLRWPRSFPTAPESLLPNPLRLQTTPEVVLRNPGRVCRNPQTVFQNPPRVLLPPERVLPSPQSVLQTPEAVLPNPLALCQTRNWLFHNDLPTKNRFIRRCRRFSQKGQSNLRSSAQSADSPPFFPVRVLKPSNINHQLTTD